MTLIWKGEQAAAGQSILIYCEQGLGDTIQFCRYIPMVAAKGFAVFFVIQKPLIGLLSSLHGVHKLLSTGDFMPTTDYRCSLLSLMHVFKSNINNVPCDIPYLIPDSGKEKTWLDKIGMQGFKVGVSWQGNPNAAVDIGRSFPLRLFKPVSKLPEVRLISLQKYVGVDQIPEFMQHHSLEVLEDFDAEQDRAFVDAAGVMANLDLVITSDTAIAHLAGALGVPVWIVLQLTPDWRWTLDLPYSPWYPTMKLFRQKQDGDWEGVFEEVRIELELQLSNAIKYYSICN